MKKTSAMQLLSTVWDHGKKDSWSRINNAMRRGLVLAIGSGLEFKASDFKEIYSKFRGQYWMSESNEWVYTDAVIEGNESAIEAFEEYKGRRPFRANDITGNSYNSFIHANSISRDRERLTVGFGFPYEGRTAFVTGFDDSAGVIRAAIYTHNHKEGKPTKLLKLTHDDVTNLFPSKSKLAKQSRELLATLQAKVIEIGDHVKATDWLRNNYGPKLNSLLTKDDLKELNSTLQIKGRVGQWRNFLCIHVDYPGVHLRRSKDGINVETSTGYNTLWTDAIKLLSIAHIAMKIPVLKKRREYLNAVQLSGMLIEGHEPRIHPDGKITVGCQAIQWKEIQDFITHYHLFV